MSLFKQMAKVRSAQLEMQLARGEFHAPATALVARGQRHPLTTVGIAAGIGLLLGRLNIHPLRVPGLGSLLGGGLAEVVSHGARLFSALGSFDLGGGGDDAPADDDGASS
jgi:hypothetical protein